MLQSCVTSAETGAGRCITSSRGKANEREILIGLLGAVERGNITQRRLSKELGIAVGLVNIYIKRCIKKGLIKVQGIPQRRYAYYLTPSGFLEKSQLIADYFVYSFDFFRRAKKSCEVTLSSLTADGHRRVAFVGASELTEIATIIATDLGVEIAVIVDPNLAKSRFLGIPVEADIEAAAGDVDAMMITSLSNPHETFDAAVALLGKKRVYLPSILGDIVLNGRTSKKANSRSAKK